MLGTWGIYSGHGGGGGMGDREYGGHGIRLGTLGIWVLWADIGDIREYGKHGSL